MQPGAKRKKRNQWRPFEEAREHVRSLNLKSQKEWREYSRRGNRPSDIPTAPDRVYEDDGWQGFSDAPGYRDWGRWWVSFR